MRGAPHRDFKGVWIPKEIWLSEDLSIQEKALLVEISSLDNENGCWASNAHFARFLGCTDRSIRNHLAGLKKHGYINIEHNKKKTKDGAYIDSRVIRVRGKLRRLKDSGLVRAEPAYDVEFVEDENGNRIARLHQRKRK